MIFNSKIVTTNQNGIHPNLIKVIEKHFIHPYRKPIAQHTLNAFQSIKQDLRTDQFILDMGCGTGQSSYYLAQKNPDKLVVGIDRSAARLEKFVHKKLDNLKLLRADIVDFLILLKENNLQASSQFYFYPNPYPKSSQLKLRWYAHPVFPTMLKVGGCFEFRSNWSLYLEELISVLKHLNVDHFKWSEFSELSHVSLFEKKYAQSGQKLYKCQFQLC